MPPARRDNTYSNLAEAQRSFWRTTVLPLVGRIAQSLSAWLAPAYARGFDAELELRPDLDAVEALAPFGRTPDCTPVNPTQGGPEPAFAEPRPDNPTRVTRYDRPTGITLLAREQIRLTTPARPSEACFTSLDLKSVADDGTFEGYASLFNREDMGRDLIVPGAFRDTLSARGPEGVRLLFQHDPAQPIGTWQTLAEDERGLFARGRIATGAARAREVLSLMRAGAIDGLSIGFRALKSRRDRSRGIRIIERIDLWEISIVTFPMLPEARIRSQRSRPFIGAPPTERQFEQWLTRDAGLTRSEARAVLRHGFKGLAAMQAAAGDPEEVRRLVQLVNRTAHALRTPITIERSI